MTATWEIASDVAGGLGVRDEDVQLGPLARPDARGRGDVDAGVADRGRDLRERSGRVLDVDDQIEGHVRAEGIVAGHVHDGRGDDGPD